MEFLFWFSGACTVQVDGEDRSTLLLGRGWCGGAVRSRRTARSTSPVSGRAAVSTPLIRAPPCLEETHGPWDELAPAQMRALKSRNLRARRTLLPTRATINLWRFRRRHGLLGTFEVERACSRICADEPFEIGLAAADSRQQKFRRLGSDRL